MKNLLWIFYKPVDEREQLIYTRAFERAFISLTIAVSLGWYFGTFFPEALSGIAVWNLIMAALLLSYGMGWFGLRNEELALHVDPLPPLRAGRYFAIFAVIAAILPVTMALVAMDIIPLVYLGRIMIGMLVLAEVTAIYWTWAVSTSLPRYSRFLASVLLAPGFILFLKWKRKNLFTFIGSQLIAVGALLFAFCVLITPFAFFVAIPYPIDTNEFEPTLKQDSFRFVDLRRRDIAANDYVVYRQNDAEHIGIVENVDDAGLTIGGNVIPWADVLGEIVVR